MLNALSGEILKGHLLKPKKSQTENNYGGFTSQTYTGCEI